MPSKKTLQLWCVTPHEHLAEMLELATDSPSRFNNFCIQKLNEAFIQIPNEDLLLIISKVLQNPNALILPLDLENVQNSALSGNQLAFNYIQLLSSYITLDLSETYLNALLTTQNYQIIVSSQTIPATIFQALPLAFQLQAVEKTDKSTAEQIIANSLTQQDTNLEFLNDAISQDEIPLNNIDSFLILNLLTTNTPTKQSLAIGLNFIQKREDFAPTYSNFISNLTFHSFNDEILEVLILAHSYLKNAQIAYQIFSFAAENSYLLTSCAGIEFVASTAISINELPNFIKICQNLSKIENLPKMLHKKLLNAFLDLLSEKETRKLLEIVYQDIMRLMSLFVGYLSEEAQSEEELEDQEVMENCESWIAYVEGWRGK